MAVFNGIPYYENEDDEIKDQMNKSNSLQKVLTLKDVMKEAVPTFRFWLMLKLRQPDKFSKKWEVFIETFKGWMRSNFTGDPKEIEYQIGQSVKRLEQSAWATMPSSFLHSLDIPRVIRR
jgi:hypothetical protein